MGDADVMPGAWQARLGRYHVTVATTEADRHAALAFRARVVADGLGAAASGAARHVDEVDRRSDHLVVWQSADDSDPDTVVATCRLSPPGGNRSGPAGVGVAMHDEFDLSPLESLLPSTIEAGRPYLDVAHRGSVPVELLWSGIARYMLKDGSRYLMGCVSVPIADGGGQAVLFRDLARGRCWAPPHLQCRPRYPFCPTMFSRADRLHMPPLVQGYLGLGARVCSEPADNQELGTADFLFLLDLYHADYSYLRRFLH